MYTLTTHDPVDLYNVRCTSVMVLRNTVLKYNRELLQRSVELDKPMISGVKGSLNNPWKTPKMGILYGRTVVPLIIRVVSGVLASFNIRHTIECLSLINSSAELAITLKRIKQPRVVIRRRFTIPPRTEPHWGRHGVGGTFGWALFTYMGQWPGTHLVDQMVNFFIENSDVIRDSISTNPK